MASEAAPLDRVRRWRRWNWAIALIAAGARAATLLSTAGYRPIHDDAAYGRTARTLLLSGRFPVHHFAHLGWFPSSYRPPAWPLALAGVWSATGIDVESARLTTLALGVATCVLGAHLGRRVGGPRTGVVAGLLLAVDPLLLSSTASIGSEALFTALLLAGVLTALRARERSGWRTAAFAGALTGAAALTRTNGLALIPLVAWLVVPLPRGRWWYRRSAVTLLAAAAVIAPWSLRNAVELHHFVPVSTEAGNTLAGTYNTTSLLHHARWLEPRQTGAYHQVYQRYPEGPVLDEHLISAVLGWVGRHPFYPVVATGWNTARLLGFDGPDWAAWSLHTMSLGSGLAVPLWLCTVLVTLLAGIELARRPTQTRGLIAVAAMLLITTAPFTGEMRLAIPIHSILVILGACTLARVWGRISEPRRLEEPQQPRGDVALA